MAITPEREVTISWHKDVRFGSHDVQIVTPPNSAGRSKREQARAIIAEILGVPESEVNNATPLGEHVNAVSMNIAFKLRQQVMAHYPMTAGQILDQLPS